MSSESNPASAAFVNEIHRFAAGRMRDGASGSQLEQDLLAKGLDAELASVVARNFVAARRRQKRFSGLQNMGIGGGVAAVGAVITGVTYSMASGGGVYVVTWGAIAFGGLQFLRGLFEFVTA